MIIEKNRGEIAGQTQRSVIKPHLLNLSGSGAALKDLVIERNLELPDSGSESQSSLPKNHIIVVYAGSPAKLLWKMDGRKNESVYSAGDSIINPSGFYAAPRWSSEAEILLLSVNPRRMNQISAEMNIHDNVEIAPRFQFRDELIRQLARGLVSEFEHDQPPDKIYAETLANTLITHIVKKYSVFGTKSLPVKTGLQKWRLKLVTDFINDNIAEDLSLEELARVADVSPSYFISLFKQSTGLAPHQYVMTRRIEKARNLLVKTHMPIADIAVHVGFADQSHLTRLMRRYIGLTPKMLRNA